MDIQFFITDKTHAAFSERICELIESSARMRGTGIARREVSYITQKISSGNAIIALQEEQVVGFCYIEAWEDKKYVANSGLIVHPDFRQLGLAKAIKKRVFDLAREKYPDAKVFGITTSAAVMKINFDLGYRPVTFSELTKDNTFWKGCESCPNFDILQRNQQKMCLCTGMLAISKNEALKTKTKSNDATK